MRGVTTSNMYESEARQLLQERLHATGFRRVGRRHHLRVQAAADFALKDAAAWAELRGELGKLRKVLQYEGWLASEQAREQARAQLRWAVNPSS